MAPEVQITGLRSLAHNPAPWSVKQKVIFDANDRKVSAASVNVLGYSNLPRSYQQADAWARKIDDLGVRVYRAHHLDGPFLDNPGAHLPRFQLLLNSLKKVKIPVIIEFASTRFDKIKLARGDPVETKRWQDYVKQFCSLDLSNVVLTFPVNEPSSTPQAIFDAQYKFIRSAGFKGLIAGSNSMVQGGPAGDVADGHYYCGLEGQKPNEFFEIEYKDQPWNHPKPQELPVVATEIGHFWPASTRYVSEWQIIESLIEVDAQIISMFALIDNDDEWTNAKKPITKDSFFNDPERLENLARLAHRMAGVFYLPRVGESGFKAEPVDGGKWRIVQSATIPKLIDSQLR